MALYACDEDDIIHASAAEPKKVYWCLECFANVKVRRGKNHLHHFYHLQASPKCRLYSKSEDHMCAQIDLQKIFPEGAIQLERPLITINRVADVCWETEKIVFEIQCSLLNPAEAASRIRDYKSAGYDIVWLLDDRIYNRKVLRPAEELLRTHWSYYFHFGRNSPSTFYDQFEAFGHGKRAKKGRKLLVDLQKVRKSPPQAFKETFPKQIILRSSNQSKYLFGDRIYWALKSFKSLPLKLLMENWRMQETYAGQKEIEPNRLALWLKKRFFWPYLRLLEKISG
ncbi:MAG TPA: competence protein CoiA family protein [Chlamydiales bacterium]|nr:competence protein CoiA family protein [Chlamydiales bacterium]